ncbi:MAG: PASTA domain-containing protein, partial [Clostridia bacterium]|nr:PASTA domain-containing protein [Clostridia bacterium]
EQKMVETPELTGLSLEEAARILRAAPLKWETDGVSDTVTAQMPPAGTLLAAGSQVMLYTAPQQAVTPEIMTAVPDVRGMSVVEASRALRARGLEMKLEGTGIAAKQSPAGGAYAAQGSEVTVTFVLP